MSEISRAAHAEKQAIIEEIKTKLESAQAAVVIDYAGITVEEANKMRKELREANVDYKIYKNTLMKRAIEGTDFEELGQILEGPSAFAMSDEDATAPARILAKSIKELDKMSFKGGIVEGAFYDAAGIEKLSKIPGRETLIAKFMGSIQSPVGKFVRTLAAIAEEKAKNGDAPAAAEEAAPAEEAPAQAPAEEAAPAEAPAEEAPAEEAPAQAAEEEKAE